jgi:hypothetical protein
MSRAYSFDLYCCMVYCFLPFQECWMYVCTRVDIGPFVESEGIAGEDPEQQQLGEGKCPLTHYVLFTYNLLSRITYLKPKD